MNSQIANERTCFAHRFEGEQHFAKKIWDASWSGKHWGRDGAIFYSKVLNDSCQSVESISQLVSSYYAAFGYAAKKVLSGNIIFLPRALLAFSKMLSWGENLSHCNTAVPLRIDNLQVLIATYNRAGEFYKKIHCDKKSDDYFKKALNLSKEYLSDIRIEIGDDVKLLLYVDMLSNLLLSKKQRSDVYKVCQHFTEFGCKTVTIKIRALRALGDAKEALRLAEELGLGDQSLKSS